MTDLADPQAFISWYTGDSLAPVARQAQNLFEEALAAFKSELSKDKTKLQWIQDSKLGSLEEVLRAVTVARSDYDARKGESKTRKRIEDLSEKIYYYGNIMDVLVQHHPEYVSLVWGAMKLLLVGVSNQQNLLSRLSTGLCQIADLLPRAELTLQLYSNARVRQVIVIMYAYILKFLMRALRWYQESKISHIMHSITRPAELRYDDLLEKISSLARALTDLALSSSHAEQRDMHTKVQQLVSGQLETHITIRTLTSLVLQLKDSVATEQVINASARIDFRQSLSEIQLAQFMGFLAKNLYLDPTLTLQFSLFMRNRRRRAKAQLGHPLFWLDRKVQRWNQKSNSSLIMISGTRKLRFHIKDFCTDSIVQLRDAEVPVIWALKVMDIRADGANTEDQITTIELLKYLVVQVIALNESIHTDAALTPRLKAYLAASSEEDWTSILTSVLQGMPLLYVIIDIELLDRSLVESTPGFSLPIAFLQIFADLAERDMQTVMKVVLVSYGSQMFRTSVSSDCRDLVLPVGGLRAGQSSVKIVAMRRGGVPSGPALGQIFQSGRGMPAMTPNRSR